MGEKRGIKFTEARSEIQIPWSEIKGNHAELTVYQTLQVGYIYPGSTTVNHFGIGTRHWMKMKNIKENGLFARTFIQMALVMTHWHPTPSQQMAVHKNSRQSKLLQKMLQGFMTV